MATSFTNAMTVDVEDYFQVSALEPYIKRSDWDAWPHRVVENTERILALFDDHNAKGTFFVLGWVAERYPALIRTIITSGHEVASHGFEHVRISEQSPEQFRKDAGNTKSLLEDTSGQAVRGFRAASFSIGEQTLWAHEVLGELEYDYSSSVYPVRHDLYGMPEAPRFPFYPTGNGILEVPITTVSIGGRNLPCGGGGYFRLLPYAYYRWAISRVNAKDNAPGIFYFHPWEIDPDQPRQKGLDLKTRFRHYLNLHRTEGRLIRLLSDFRWGRMDDVFLSAKRDDNDDALDTAGVATW